MPSEYLLNPQNLKILESFLVANTLVAFDYDGTLAPLCADPTKASMTPVMYQALGKLMKQCNVAIITGRSVSDTRLLLPEGPVSIIGNHGCEGLQRTEELHQILADCEQWHKMLKRNLADLELLGVNIENKKFSLTLHYRQSPSPQQATALIQHLVAKLPRAVVSPGKYVFNITSELSWDKGTAMNQLMKQNNHLFGIYFGDDLTDEDVFRFPNSNILSVKIGLEPSPAKYHLTNQMEMEEVLSFLLSLSSKTCSV